MKLKLHNLILPAILMLLSSSLISSCNQKPMLVFTENTCQAPCWMGIIPGKTTLQQGIDIIHRIDFVTDISELRSKSEVHDTLYFAFEKKYREAFGYIYSNKGIVEQIGFSPSSNNLTLGDIFHTIGTPDEYLSIYYTTAESHYYAISIYYKEKGITLHNTTFSGKDDIEFYPDMPIELIVFTQPEMITKPEQDGTINQLNDTELAKGLTSWTGFNKIISIKIK